MAQTDHFIKLVASMREAQRDYQENRTRHNEAELRKCETLVDEWLLTYTAQQVQMELWGKQWMTDEEPAAYNVTHDAKKTEGGDG